MKHQSSLSRFIAVILPIAMIATLAGLQPLSASADGGYLTLNSFSGHPGVTLQVSGGGFGANQTLSISVGGSVVTTVSTVADGSFSLPLTLSASLPQGPLSISAVEADNNETAANSYYVQPFTPALQLGSGSAYPLGSVTVAGSHAQSSVQVGVGQYYPNGSPSSYFILPGGQLSFNGNSFAPGDPVSVTEDADPTVLASFTADAAGSFKVAGTVTVPYVDAGAAHTFHLRGGLSRAGADVTVTVGQYYPVASPSDYYLMPGSVITFTGSSFAPNDTVQLTEDKNSAVLATITADSTGSFKKAGAITIPFTDAGSGHTFHLRGELIRAGVDLAVTVGQLNPLLNPSSYYLLPGQAYSIAGTGFAPTEDVILTQGTTQLSHMAADSLGSVNFAGLVFPATRKPTLTFTATGQSSSAASTVDIAAGQYYPYALSDNYYTQPGSTVTVQGFSFAPGETVTVTDGTSQTTTADSFGNTGKVKVTIPYGGSASTSTVTLTGSMSGATATVPVTLAPFMAQVTPSTYYARPGTGVTFSGSGFAPGESIAITLNKTAAGTVTADSKGAFTGFSSTLPFGQTASYVFTGSLSNAPVTVTVTLASFYAGLTLDNYYGVGGTPVTLSGNGFAPGEPLSLTFGATTFGPVTADAHGGFTFATTVPYATAGDKKVTATGQLSGAMASTTYTQAPVYVSFQLGAYAGAPGSRVTFIGSGYLPNEPIQITTDRDTGTVYTFTADASGHFNDSGFTVPMSYAEGNLKLTATGTHSLTPETIVYYVTGK
ncbi:hypothetical protein KGQ71_02150 [Patescibacteria group bacterium]|nr:hypothetical protein [Patescibacteria group bacterium]